MNALLRFARRRAPAALALGAAIVVPPVLGAGWTFVATLAATYTVAALSLVLLTGYAGQISLAQGAFLGVGAFAVGIISQRLGVPMWGAVPLAMAASVPVSLVIGLPSLRLRGFQLAIATLGFAVAAQRWVFGWVVGKLVGRGAAGSDALRVGISRPSPFGIDLRDDFRFYVFALAVAALCVWLVANLGKGRSGRAFFAVREGEVAASTLGINVEARKLLAFVLSGVLASLAGVLLGMTLFSAHGTSYHFFLSITIFSIAVIGGIGSVWGAALGGIFYAGFPKLLSGIPGLRVGGITDLVSGLGLVAFMMSEPEGLAGAMRRLGERLRRRAVTREPAPALPVSIRDLAVPERPAVESGDRAPLLEAREITVRFGGVVALDRVSLPVPKGNIVGLIGPNGAGKTTLFNCISGLVAPAGGEILFEGRRIDGLRPHRRARLGIGRTYQVIRPFPHLTVEENLLVAQVPRLKATLADDLLRTPRVRAEEMLARGRARAVLELLGIGSIRDTRVADLPYGHLKLTEVARALVAEPTLLMLDEPAAGLDEDETRLLGEHIGRIRDELGVTVLLVEHDMNLVMPISDLVAVLELGKLIATGTPGEVRRDPDVVAAYLGEEPVSVAERLGE